MSTECIADPNLSTPNDIEAEGEETSMEEVENIIKNNLKNLTSLALHEQNEDNGDKENTEDLSEIVDRDSKTDKSIVEIVDTLEQEKNERVRNEKIKNNNNDTLKCDTESTGIAEDSSKSDQNFPGGRKIDLTNINGMCTLDTPALSSEDLLEDITSVINADGDFIYEDEQNAEDLSASPDPELKPRGPSALFLTESQKVEKITVEMKASQPFGGLRTAQEAKLSAFQSQMNKMSGNKALTELATECGSVNKDEEKERLVNAHKEQSNETHPICNDGSDVNPTVTLNQSCPSNEPKEPADDFSPGNMTAADYALLIDKSLNNEKCHYRLRNIFNESLETEIKLQDGSMVNSPALADIVTDGEDNTSVDRDSPPLCSLEFDETLTSSFDELQLHQRDSMDLLEHGVRGRPKSQKIQRRAVPQRIEPRPSLATTQNLPQCVVGAQFSNCIPQYPTPVSQPGKIMSPASLAGGTQVTHRFPVVVHGDPRGTSQCYLQVLPPDGYTNPMSQSSDPNLTSPSVISRRGDQAQDVSETASVSTKTDGESDNVASTLDPTTPGDQSSNSPMESEAPSLQTDGPPGPPTGHFNYNTSSTGAMMNFGQQPMNAVGSGYQVPFGMQQQQNDGMLRRQQDRPLMGVDSFVSSGVVPTGSSQIPQGGTAGGTGSPMRVNAVQTMRELGVQGPPENILPNMGEFANVSRQNIVDPSLVMHRGQIPNGSAGLPYINQGNMNPLATAQCPQFQQLVSAPQTITSSTVNPCTNAAAAGGTLEMQHLPTGDKRSVRWRMMLGNQSHTMTTTISSSTPIGNHMYVQSTGAFPLPENVIQTQLLGNVAQYQNPLEPHGQGYPYLGHEDLHPHTRGGKAERIRTHSRPASASSSTKSRRESDIQLPVERSKSRVSQWLINSANFRHDLDSGTYDPSDDSLKAQPPASRVSPTAGRMVNPAAGMVASEGSMADLPGNNCPRDIEIMGFTGQPYLVTFEPPQQKQKPPKRNSSGQGSSKVSSSKQKAQSNTKQPVSSASDVSMVSMSSQSSEKTEDHSKTKGDNKQGMQSSSQYLPQVPPTQVPNIHHEGCAAIQNNLIDRELMQQVRKISEKPLPGQAQLYEHTDTLNDRREADLVIAQDMRMLRDKSLENFLAGFSSSSDSDQVISGLEHILSSGEMEKLSMSSDEIRNWLVQRFEENNRNTNVDKPQTATAAGQACTGVEPKQSSFELTKYITDADKESLQKAQMGKSSIEKYLLTSTNSGGSMKSQSSLPNQPPVDNGMLTEIPLKDLEEIIGQGRESHQQLPQKTLKRRQGGAGGNISQSSYKNHEEVLHNQRARPQQQTYGNITDATMIQNRAQRLQGSQNIMNQVLQCQNTSMQQGQQGFPNFISQSQNPAVSMNNLHPQPNPQMSTAGGYPQERIAAGQFPGNVPLGFSQQRLCDLSMSGSQAFSPFDTCVVSPNNGNDQDSHLRMSTGSSTDSSRTHPQQQQWQHQQVVAMRQNMTPAVQTPQPLPFSTAVPTASVTTTHFKKPYNVASYTTSMAHGMPPHPNSFGGDSDISMKSDTSTHERLGQQDNLIMDAREQTAQVTVRGNQNVHTTGQASDMQRMSNMPKVSKASLDPKSKVLEWQQQHERYLQKQQKEQQQLLFQGPQGQDQLLQQALQQYVNEQMHHHQRTPITTAVPQRTPVPALSSNSAHQISHIAHQGHQDQPVQRQPGFHHVTQSHNHLSANEQMMQQHLSRIPSSSPNNGQSFTHIIQSNTSATPSNTHLTPFDPSAIPFTSSNPTVPHSTTRANLGAPHFTPQQSHLAVQGNQRAMPSQSPSPGTRMMMLPRPTPPEDQLQQILEGDFPPLESIDFDEDPFILSARGVSSPAASSSHNEPLKARGLSGRIGSIEKDGSSEEEQSLGQKRETLDSSLMRKEGDSDVSAVTVDDTSLGSGPDLPSFQPDSDGETSLFFLCEMPSQGREKLSSLPGFHQALNLLSNSQETALFVAVKSGDTEVVKFLTSHGADVNVMCLSSAKTYRSTRVQQTALHEAVELGKADIVRALLAVDRTDVDAKRPGTGLTPLMVALQVHGSANRKDIVMELIKHQASLTLQDTLQGKTPLMYAIQSRDVAIVEQILDLVGAEKARDLVTATAKKGMTCLHFAAELRLESSKKQKLLRCIITSGGDASVRNAEGETARDWAKKDITTVLQNLAKP